MICTKCDFEGDSSYFSKTNLNKDGTKAMCKKCKRDHDIAYRQNKATNQSKLPEISLFPDLLTKTGECLSCPKCGYKWQR